MFFTRFFSVLLFLLLSLGVIATFAAFEHWMATTSDDGHGGHHTAKFFTFLFVIAILVVRSIGSLVIALFFGLRSLSSKKVVDDFDESVYGSNRAIMEKAYDKSVYGFNTALILWIVTGLFSFFYVGMGTGDWITVTRFVSIVFLATSSIIVLSSLPNTKNQTNYYSYERNDTDQQDRWRDGESSDSKSDEQFFICVILNLGVVTSIIAYNYPFSLEGSDAFLLKAGLLISVSGMVGRLFRSLEIALVVSYDVFIGHYLFESMLNWTKLSALSSALYLMIVFLIASPGLKARIEKNRRRIEKKRRKRMEPSPQEQKARLNAEHKEILEQLRLENASRAEVTRREAEAQRQRAETVKRAKQKNEEREKIAKEEQEERERTLIEHPEKYRDLRQQIQLEYFKQLDLLRSEFSEKDLEEFFGEHIHDGVPYQSAETAQKNLYARFTKIIAREQARRTYDSHRNVLQTHYTESMLLRYMKDLMNDERESAAVVKAGNEIESLLKEKHDELRPAYNEKVGLQKIHEEAGKKHQQIHDKLSQIEAKRADVFASGRPEHEQTALLEMLDQKQSEVNGDLQKLLQQHPHVERQPDESIKSQDEGI